MSGTGTQQRKRKAESDADGETAKRSRTESATTTEVVLKDVMLRGVRETLGSAWCVATTNTGARVSGTFPLVSSHVQYTLRCTRAAAGGNAYRLVQCTAMSVLPLTRARLATLLREAGDSEARADMRVNALMGQDGMLEAPVPEQRLRRQPWFTSVLLARTTYFACRERVELLSAVAAMPEASRDVMQLTSRDATYCTELLRDDAQRWRLCAAWTRTRARGFAEIPPEQLSFEDPCAVRALKMYQDVLRPVYCAGSGDTYWTREQLQALLPRAGYADGMALLPWLTRHGVLHVSVAVDGGGGGHYQLAEARERGACIAAGVAALLQQEPLATLDDSDDDEETTQQQQQQQAGLSAEQYRALRNSATRRLLLVTGVPGSGKTHLLARVVRERRAAGLRVLVLSPRGAGCERTREALAKAGVKHVECATIDHFVMSQRARLKRHGKLRRQEGEAAAKAMKKKPRSGRYCIIVDEASLCGENHLADLLQGVLVDGAEHNAHKHVQQDGLDALRCEQLLLFGDPWQCSPMGYGAPFRDLLALCAAGHASDAGCHVQLGESQRTQLALLHGNFAAIRDGHGERVAFGKSGFVLRKPAPANGLDGTVSSYATKHAQDMESTQFITHRNDTCEHFNGVIARALLSKIHADSKAAVAHIRKAMDAHARGGHATLLYRGLRVVATRNVAKQSVGGFVSDAIFNGSVDVIARLYWRDAGGGEHDVLTSADAAPTQAGADARLCVALKQSGRTLDLATVGASNLKPGYVVTADRSQGSEHRVVGALLHRRPDTAGAPGTVSPHFTRDCLYTIVSRAQEEVHVFGELADLRTIVAQPPPQRRTLLCGDIQRRLRAPSPIVWGLEHSSSDSLPSSSSCDHRDSVDDDDDDDDDDEDPLLRGMWDDGDDTVSPAN